MKEVLLDTIIDSAKILPFLFLTYLAMEYIEHKTSSKAGETIRKAGCLGPIPGGLIGIVPQCGFSAAAANLYAARIITLGTLFSVFLSTSDEMLPILISEKLSFSVIARILGMKAVIGMAAGFAVDFLVRRRGGGEEQGLRIGHMCEHDHCHCEHGGIVRSALSHTLRILIYIFLITLALNLAISLVGEQRLAGLVLNRPVVGALIAGLVGLIPNCASSVIITQLYLEGLLSMGAAMAGLLSGTGIGLLVLFRVNDNKKENIRITLLLYAIGVVSGILIDGLGWGITIL